MCRGIAASNTTSKVESAQVLILTNSTVSGNRSGVGPSGNGFGGGIWSSNGVADRHWSLTTDPLKCGFPRFA